MEWDKHEFSKVIVMRALTAFFIQMAVAFILSFVLAFFRPESAEVPIRLAAEGTPVYIAIVTGYLGKAAFENYNKNKPPAASKATPASVERSDQYSK